MSKVVRAGNHLRNAEIHQSHLPALANLDVGWFDISMHDSAPVTLDIGYESVKLFDLRENFDRVLAGPPRIQAPFAVQDFRDVATLEVLHGNEEATALVAEVIDFEDPLVDLTELLLDFNAPPFGVDHDPRELIGRLLDQFEDDEFFQDRIERKVDVRHAPAELTDNLVSPEALPNHGYFSSLLDRRNPASVATPASKPV
jgi:hypothetical protein